MDLIHRDISPENIMLSQDQKGKLLVKVIDFGIAKQLAEGEGGQGLTQTGMFLGKLKYASPEQAGFLKEGEHLDPRSDLYSFGIVLYEMLAGRAPFQATNPHGYILKHVTEKPAPISEINPAVKVPPQLEAVIMKSLEKNRAARYETAGEFAKALEDLRASIAPDQKFGVGEKMITLSGAQTLADLPKFTGTQPSPTMGGGQATQQTMAGTMPTGTFPGGTMPGGTMPGGTVARPTGPTGTKIGSDEATVMERGLASPQNRTLGSDEATLMERLGSPSNAAATVLESKAKWGDSAPAEATVLERQMSMTPQKKSPMLWIGIAAAVVIAIGIGVVMMMRKPAPVPVATNTATTGTEITTTTPRPVEPIAGGQGMLLLSASPWGDLQKIVDKDDKKEIMLDDEARSTPSAIKLDPGTYSVTIRGPKGDKTVDVQIEAGKRTPHNIDMDKVDLDALAEEVSKP
jgi:hypothetical protein